MMTDVKNIDGHFYPAVHRGWGGFAEEVFHYTSRYYCTTEAFLQALVDDPRFTMSGYKATSLSPSQRELMAAVLACPPGPETGAAVVAIIGRVLRGDPGVDAMLVERYHDRLEHLPKHETVERHHPATDDTPDGVDPLDPFMSLAERLLMPVAVHDGHVEVSMHDLARHLQSPNSTLRTNLHNAILALHEAGYVLRNHPHLTHNEAHAIEGDDMP